MVHLEVSGVLYFAATDGVHGRTLWRTDGSEAGTVAVQDGAEGSAIFDPYDFVGLNGLLLGAARLGGSFETGVWVSDGTRGGTSWLRRWERGQISRLSVFAGAVWFTVNVGPDSELWKTDGTVGGTVRATVLEGQSIQPWSLSPANGRMYLFAYTSTGSVGGSLWASDESGSHVVRVRERVPGASGDPGTVFEADGYFYFEAGDPVRRLWRTDGTSDGTTAIGPSILGEVFRADPGLYLTGVRSNETELWTVGSARGEAIRIRAFTNVSGQYRPPSGFLRLGTKVIFQATESEEGAELWGSDGTSGGTKRLADLVPGKASGFPWPLGRVGGLGLIGARDADGGASLWRTDGTEAGTERIRSLRPGQPGTHSWVVSVAGGAESGRVFAWVGTGRLTEAPAEPAELPPFELWVTDGTANGTRSLATFDSRSGAGPVFMAEVGKVVLFTVPKEHGSYEVWRTDGTPEGTFVVRDAFPERDAGSGPWSLVERRGRLFFLMKDDAYLDQLWSSDGTSAGTSPVHAWAASDESAWNAPELVNVSDTLFFVRVTSKGSALWRSDGTDAGTLPVVVRDVTIDGLAGAGGRLFFREGDGGLGTSDGTAAGTRIVRRFDQILPGPKGKGPIACGDRVYFVAATGDVGSELRVSDGTEAGTRLVRDLTPGAAGSQLTGLTPVGERLFFARSDGPDTWSLWVTDGTDTGTVR
ncbi:MAG: hypothetical protein JNL97_13880, partial [Verrucomicrobiales bacterium]|nr:hypothetical protein [Verrucomicrobiales bacterium]